uniref:Uncharacterized protein n=1 Tax=Candidatus Kentrum sp. UNK TaxID=2126344 RepID=A0A451A2Y8_9GAMM|nr:MAG: hypothetical protein BECKUNK1418G_GA0071005_101133 [Candidatus Kentron sp. UNK]VFK69246.1 MAG: hypothetical protein BECKUNK1418H_GA0071006_101232 [Candidatus Kentron sp. UNK]
MTVSNLVKSMIGALLLSVTGAVFAEGEGSAIIPRWMKHPAGASHLQITNITDVQVDVVVRLYDQNGNTYDNTVHGAITCDPWMACNVNQPAMTMVIPPHGTGQFYVNNSVGGGAWYGYGKISWSYSGAEDTPKPNQALIANGYYYTTNGRAEFPINNWQPF